MAHQYYDDGSVIVDSRKDRWNLLPWDGLIWVVRAMMAGCTKERPANNWKKSKRPEDFLEAAQRHMVALHIGEWLDQKSGLPHVSHAIASLLIYHWLWIRQEPKNLVTTGDLEGREGQ